MEVESHLGEALCAGTHVLTHLLHLRRGLDQRRRACDLLPVLAGQSTGNALDGHEVLHHRFARPFQVLNALPPILA